MIAQKLRHSIGMAVALTIVGLNSGALHAAVVAIQPDEIASKDTFLYEGSPGANLELGFPTFLGVSASDDHETITLLEFDLSGISGHVTSAILTLNTQTAQFPYHDPTVEHPADVNVYANLEPWEENTVTYATLPAISDSDLVATAKVTGIGETVSFDITDLVNRWLSGELVNSGVQLVQANAVNNGVGEVGVTFHSASSANPVLRPSLTIVPEPAGAGIAIFTTTILAAGARRRHRRSAKNAAPLGR